MADKPTSTESLGLEINSKSIKGAELTLAKGTPQLVNIFEVTVDQTNKDPADVKLLYTEKEKVNFNHLLEKNLVVSTLPTTEVLIRQLEVNLTSEKDIDSVLEFSAEPLLPYPIEEGFIDRIITSKQSESSSLTVIGTRKEFVKEHLKKCHSIHIEPEMVTCTPAALASFSKLFSPTEHPHISLHLGYDCITCALIVNGKLIKAQSTEKGVRELDNANDEDKGTILDSILFDATRIVFALTKQANKHTVTGILYLGEGAETPELIKLIQSNLELTTLQIKKNKGFTAPEIKLQKYAVAIGSALSAFDKNFDQINFRQDELSYPFPWKRIQRPLLSYLILSLFLGATFFIFGNVYLNKQQDQIRERYVELLAYMKTPYSEFEKKITGKETITPEQLNALNLSTGEINKRLTLLEKEIRASPDLIPLFPNTPRVSDVLAWLSTHPHITGVNGEKPFIELLSMSYKMVKRPEENKKRSKYQVKVEIEFTTPIPKYAREFHDILLSPNAIIDPKADVKWGSERGKYRASFFLKDKTLYPQ